MKILIIVSIIVDLLLLHHRSVTPLGMFLAPVPTDPTNQVDVWVRSYQWHGQPLIQVVQSEGTFTRATAGVPGSYSPPIEVDFMPEDGYIQLDMYSKYSYTNL
jgi:hypothetical protein